jgi:hypothetical protein
MNRIVSLSVALLLLLGGITAVAETDTVEKSVEMETAEQLSISCEFGAGDLTITPADLAEAARVKIIYDPRKFDYDIDYEVRGSIGHLDMESSTHRRSIKNAKNRWDVQLSSRHPCELDLDIGACEAEIDLGGIPITDLMMDIGAASGTIDFSKKNPERMEDLDIDIGASSIDISNLGNANFEYFSFSNGAASSTLDFHGDWTGDAMVKLEIGLGSADLIIPKDLPVRIETGGENWFSSIDFHGEDLDEVREGVFESPGFREADDRLTIEMDIGMGSVDVKFR